MTIEIMIDIVGIVVEFSLTGALLFLGIRIYNLELEIQEHAFYIGQAFGVSEEPTDEEWKQYADNILPR